MYFTDTGLACALLGLEAQDQVSRDPAAGGLVENWFIIEYLKCRWNQGREAPIYFFRDRQGSEVDLLITRGRELIAVEIKSSSTFTPSYLKGLKRFANLAEDRLIESYLAYNGEQLGHVDGVELMTLNNVRKLI